MSIFDIMNTPTKGRFAVITRQVAGETMTCEYPIPPRRVTEEDIRAYFDKEFRGKPYTWEQVIER